MGIVYKYTYTPRRHRTLCLSDDLLTEQLLYFATTIRYVSPERVGCSFGVQQRGYLREFLLPIGAQLGPPTPRRVPIGSRGAYGVT